MAEKDNLATRMFKDRTSAEREYAALVARGYSSKDINVLMTEEARKRHFGAGAPATALGSKATAYTVVNEHGDGEPVFVSVGTLEGAGVGGGIGAVAGGTLAVIVMAAAVVIPGLEVIVAGPMVAALAGVSAGTVAGGAIGALVGAGIPQERVKEYASALKKGGILLGVKPRTPEDRAYFDREWGGDRADTGTARRGL